MIVIQRTGTLNLNNRKPIRRVTSSQHKQVLLSEDVIDIKVESKSPLDFYIGDKIEYSGRFFYLNSMPKVVKEQGFYSYNLTFEGAQYLLRKKIYFNLDKTGFQTSADFPLTGEIDIFLKVLINNINSVENGTWILGGYPKNTEGKTLTFSNENCLAVLQKICKEFDTEFEIKEDVNTGTKTLNIKKIGNTKDFVFEYGKGNGLYSINRDNVADDVVTRLYVYGSSDNIPTKYRDYSEKLRMPQAQGDYLQDDEKVKLFGMKEAVKVFEDIKPTFKGIVSGIGRFDEASKTQEIFVSNMDFDLMEKDTEGNTKYLIAGTPAKLHFNKGNLAGYDFELLALTGYNHATKCFKVKQFTDERGQKFPDNNTIFSFEVGDEFTITDIVMPEMYITRAEQKLLEAGKNEYAKLSQNNTKYSITIDPMFLKKKGNESTVFFEIGDYIRVVDNPLKIDKTSRIISMTRDLLNRFSYTLEIADTYEVSFTTSVLNDIKDTKKVVKSQTQVIRENYKNGYKNILELKDSIFDTDGHFDPEHIKPHSIETNMLSVGARSQNFVLEDVVLNPNVNGEPANVSISGGRLVHFSIAEDIKVWELLPLQQQNLLDIVYYVYAKVEKNGTSGSWHITTDKIKFDEMPDYYYFLCYLLYTPKGGKREAEAMYGNVTMHGGQITAGRIKSLNGQTYLDLDTGEISGKITFVMPDGTTTSNVEKGMLGNTIIEGGKIKSTLINVEEIAVKAGEHVNADIGDIKKKTDNFTSIKGGLVSSNIISVGDDKDNQNAFISGVTDKGGESVRFGAGTGYKNKDNAPFRVLANGKMIAENADISGKIDAREGKIGRVNIREGWLTAGERGKNDMYLSDEMFGITQNYDDDDLIGGTGYKKVSIGRTSAVSSDPKNVGAAMKVEHNRTPKIAFTNDENVALWLEAKNNQRQNIALDITAGDIRVLGKKGYTGSFSIVVKDSSGWGESRITTKIDVTNGIITNVTQK